MSNGLKFPRAPYEAAQAIVNHARLTNDPKADGMKGTRIEIGFEALHEALAAWIVDRHDEPIPMLLHCPLCNARHVDAGDFATKVHHTHACQSCGHCWRPAIEPTVGVQFLPGFKDEPSSGDVR